MKLTNPDSTGPFTMFGVISASTGLPALAVQSNKALTMQATGGTNPLINSNSAGQALTVTGTSGDVKVDLSGASSFHLDAAFGLVATASSGNLSITTATSGTIVNQSERSLYRRATLAIESSKPLN